MSPKPIPTELPPTGYIRQRKLIPAIVPVSPATLWRWVKSGQFPPPCKLGQNTTAWNVQHVRQWLDSKAAK